MADFVRVPVKHLGAERWGELSLLGDAHLICGESVRLKEGNYSYVGVTDGCSHCFKMTCPCRCHEALARQPLNFWE